MPRGFKELSSTIEGIYRDLGLLEEFILGWIKNKWSEIVGEGLSAHSEPSVFKDGELLIKVSSHLWAEEMRFNSDLILQKLKPFRVKALKFKIGKIKSRVMLRTTGPEVESASLPSKEISEMAESAVLLINDQKLRDSIKRAMEKSLVRGQRL